MSIDRRTLLGWLVALAGSLGLIALFGVFNEGIGRLGRFPAKKLRAWRSRHRHTARDRRKRLRALPLWQDVQMVANVRRNPDVVHWPYPGLFKLRYRVKPENSLPIPVTDWAKKVIAEKRTFEQSHSCAILEQLALREIQVSANQPAPNFSALPAAVHVIETALSLRENRRDPKHSRRLYELLARLICLQHEKDPAKAKTQLLKTEHLAEALPWVKEQDRFTSFYQKTVDRQGGHFRFRKKLQKRVTAAHNLVGRASSSGKDTA